MLDSPLLPLDHELGRQRSLWADDNRDSFRDSRIKWPEVLSREASEIQGLRGARLSPNTEDRVKFSLAFGGGGVRAAAFQAGVLWRLAEVGKLQQVEYLSANSGGAYIAAALASHLCEAGLPEASEQVSRWYLAAVARMIDRMLRNAPYFIRSLDRDVWTRPTDGSSVLPRIFDVPISLSVIAFTIIFRPVMMGTILICPLLEGYDWFFGAGMRAAFCAPTDGRVLATLMDLTDFLTYVDVLLLLLLLTFFAWIAGKCGIRRRKKLGMQTWLWVRSSVAAFNRLTVFLLLVLCVVLVVALVQDLLYRMVPALSQEKNALCTRYYGTDKAVDEPRSTALYGGTCADFIGGTLWYSDLEHRPTSELMFNTHQRKKEARRWHFLAYELSAMLAGLSLLVLLAVILCPLLPQLFVRILGVLGPLALLGFLCLLVQWRVYNPIIGGPHDTSRIMNAGIITAMVIMPFYSYLSSSLHLYYRRCLQRTYMARGEDLAWGKVRANPYCPFLIFNGTITDYMRPTDKYPVSELSFSMLFVGGERTDYVRTRSTESAVKFMAISAAATDAFILGMNDMKGNRFWFSLLGLGMGRDLILDLDHERSTLARLLVRMYSGNRHWLMRKLLRVNRRLPALLVSELMFTLLLVAHHQSTQVGVACCRRVGYMYAASAMLGVTMFVLSFYGFLHNLAWLVEWPILQHLHQFTRFYHCAERSPSMLYVTDGGAVDSSGVLQLLRRQCERILFVLNEDDPADRLPGLRKLLHAAIEEKLAAFYDPVDPRCDWKEVLQAFAEDGSIPFMHLGIYYGWQGEERITGHLLIIKNRIRKDKLDTYVKPLLTEAEVLGGSNSDHSDSNGNRGKLCKMRQAELGGCACCCDCCHGYSAINNRGRRFPSAPIVNQLLTPSYLSELCRLGREVSQEAIDFITQPGSLELGWESLVGGKVAERTRSCSFHSFSSESSQEFEF